MNNNFYSIIEIQSKDEMEQLGRKEKYWIYNSQIDHKKLFCKWVEKIVQAEDFRGLK